MNATDFEKQLTDRGFYFENPSLMVAGTDKDAEFYAPEQLIDILIHEQTMTGKATGGFKTMVRRRGEGVGQMSYYFKDTQCSEYFKVVCPTGASTGDGIMANIQVPDWAQSILWHVAKGFIVGAAFVVAKSPLNINNWFDAKTLLIAVLTGGVYGVAVEVLNFLQPKVTAAGGKPTKTIREKLSF
ncbi:Uncharacterised protein [Candidatus Anstonella stagnisolia]|nr:Uncharacterised protein [Candidatus Anstonella stagnisolia]